MTTVPTPNTGATDETTSVATSSTNGADPTVDEVLLVCRRSMPLLGAPQPSSQAVARARTNA